VPDALGGTVDGIVDLGELDEAAEVSVPVEQIMEGFVNDSGAPDVMLHPLALALGADAAIGTVLETENGRFTGIVVGEHLYGPAKTAILKEKSEELKLDFEKSVVYANDATDAEHMRLFGTAVAVNPRAGLRREAGRRGWRVVHWDSE